MRDGFAYCCYTTVVTVRSRVARTSVFVAGVAVATAAVQFWG
jgi:hypothetical protein